MPKQKIKVLVVGYKPPPYHGVVRMTEVLLNSELLNENLKIKPFFLKAVNNAEIRGKFAFLNVVYTLQNIIRFFIKCLLGRFDILYLAVSQNNNGFLRDSLFVLIGKLLKIKIVGHYHAGEFLKNFASKSKVFQFYMKFVLKRLDKLIVLSQGIKREFCNILEAAKIEVMYNFVPEESTPEDIPRHSFENKTLKILFIGYISKAKGAVDLVRAAKIVIDKIGTAKNIEFNLCGDFVDIERNVTYIDNPNGGYTEIIDFVKKNDLEDNVNLLGYVDEETKRDLLRESHIFVLPSYSEGFPVSVLEAMSYALPLVLTPVGALSEVFSENENTFFIEPGDYESLANKIIYLLENEDICEKMGKNNFSQIKNEYNLKIYENKFLKILGSFHGENYKK